MLWRWSFRLDPSFRWGDGTEGGPRMNPPRLITLVVALIVVLAVIWYTR